MPKRKISELISPSNIKNYILKDPIIDYLELQSNKSNNDFDEFIKKKGKEFEKDVMDKFPCEFTNASKESYSKIKKLLKNKTPVIYQPVLYNYKNDTFGYPDLIIRGDYLNKYFNQNENPDDYYIIDIKFSSIIISSNKTYILNSGLFPYYKCQLLLYTLALNELLKQNVIKSFILGKRIISTSKGIKTIINNNEYNKLCSVNFNDSDKICFENLKNAINWNKKLRTEGMSWLLYPNPSIKELYPNMSNRYDIKWRDVKKKIANEIKDLTNIIYVGPKQREYAFDRNIYSYDDKNCSANNLNIKGKRAVIVDNIIKINNSNNDIILPKKISTDYWRKINNNFLEIYLDYETTTDFIDNIFIFMIGVGYILNDEWIFKTFILKNKNDNKDLFDEFWEYINNILKLNKKEEALFIHWTSAEPIAYNNIKNKLKIPEKNFLDLYKVFINEPIVVKNAFNYSLKSIAKAMYDNGLIKTLWDNNSECNNGLNALFIAFKIYNSNEVIDNTKLKDIIYYNEVDCKVLYEILFYLRKNH